MPSTPTYALRYPAASDPADVPLDLQRLAEDVEAIIAQRSGIKVIEDKLLAASAASFDFQSIPSTFAHLRLVMLLRTDGAGTTQEARARFNNDAGPNYNYQLIAASGSAAPSAFLFTGQAQAFLGATPTANSGAGQFAPIVLDLPHYAGTTRKTGVAASGHMAGGGLNLTTADWTGTDAVNRLTVFSQSGNWVAGSRATLYGLRAGV